MQHQYMRPPNEAAVSCTNLAEFINDRMAQDEAPADFNDLLAREIGGYQFAHPDLATLVEVKTSSCPQVVKNRILDERKANYSMGLFTAIKHGYVFSGNTLYMWNINDEKQFMSTEGINGDIIAVAFVNLRKDCTRYRQTTAVVISTQSEVVIKYVVKNNCREYILRDSNFKIPTEDIRFHKLFGTENGRIFMCGSDGKIWEFDYQEEQSSFLGGKRSSRKRKLNEGALGGWLFNPLKLLTRHETIDLVSMVAIDSKNRYVYTLTKSNSIHVYDLRNGSGFSDIATNARVKQQAVSILNRSSSSGRSSPKQLIDKWAESFTIVAIHPIEDSESKSLSLVAVTEEAVRIYFRLNGGSLKTIHVRLSNRRLTEAPFNVERSESREFTLPTFLHSESPTRITGSVHKDGCFLVTNAVKIGGQESTDLSLLASDTGSKPGKRPGLAETIESQNFRGQISEIGEMPMLDRSAPSVANFMYAKDYSKPLEGLSEFATQHILPARQFAVLTADCKIYVYKKLRSIELLAASLGKPCNSTLRDMTEEWGPQELCSMLLHLACDRTLVSQFGEEEKYYGAGNTATKEFFLHSEPNYGLVTSQGFLSIEWSVKVRSILRYMARLLRPVWKWSIATINKDGSVGCRHSVGHIKDCKKPLVRLHAFLKRNWDELRGKKGIQPMFRDEAKTPEAMRRHDVQVIEGKFMDSTFTLLERCIEGFTLLERLQGIRGISFGKIVTELKDKNRSNITKFVFGQFVVLPDGEELARDLVKTLSKMDDRQTNDIYKDCPNMFKLTDILLHDGDGLVQKAKETQNQSHRNSLLQQAYQKYLLALQSCQSDFPLAIVNAQLMSVGHFRGVVDLCLQHASRTQTTSLMSEPACTEIFKCLEVVDKSSEVTGDEMQKVIEAAMDSNDKQFHYKLYRWIFAHPRFSSGSSVLAKKSENGWLEGFLVEQARSNIEYVQHLKKYYHENHMIKETVNLLLCWGKTKEQEIPSNIRNWYFADALEICRSNANEPGMSTLTQMATSCNRVMAAAVTVMSLLGDATKRNTEIISDLADGSNPEELVRRRKIREELVRATNNIDKNWYGFQELYQIAMQCHCDPGCLVVMFYAGNHPSDQVESHWKKLIESEVKLRMNPQNRLRAGGREWNQYLGPSISNLMKILHGGVRDKYAPASFIVCYLEKMNFQYRVRPDADLVVPLLLNAKFDMLNILEAYQNIAVSLSTSPPKWLSSPQAQHLIVESFFKVLKALYDTRYGDDQTFIPSARAACRTYGVISANCENWFSTLDNSTRQNLQMKLGEGKKMIGAFESMLNRR